MSAYYWETFMDEDAILKHLARQECELFDCQSEPISESMKESYPTYEKRDYLAYQYGSCVGYTTRGVIETLLKQGGIYRHDALHSFRLRS